MDSRSADRRKFRESIGMIDRFNMGFAASLISGGLLWSGTALHAQTASAVRVASADAVLEEIVVTARKREEELQTVPLSVTAVSGDQLKQESVRLVTDLQGQIPSLYTQQANDDPQSVQFTIRGRKQNDVVLSVDPSVGFYVDGLYIPRGLGMQGALLDLERVEVLRGPQGTLYGRNTTSGALALYTKNPTNELSGSIDVSGGNFGAWNVVGIANVPIASNLEARFVMQRGSHDGYGHNAVGGNLASEDSQYYRAKLHWVASDTWDALFSTHYESNKSGGSLFKLSGLTPANFQGNGLPEGGLLNLETQAETGLNAAQSAALLESVVAKSKSDFYANSSIYPSSSDIRRMDGALTINGNLENGLTFRSITGAQRLIRDGVFGSPTPVVAYNSNIHADDNYYSQEFQLLGTAPNFNWVVGIYGGYEKGHDNFAVLFLPNVFGPALNIQIVQDINTSAAAFAQSVWEFVPDWRLTTGARYSRDTRQSDVSQLVGTSCQVPAPGVESLLLGGASQCPRTFKNNFDKPVWLVSIDHTLTPGVLAYAKVATGYRSGGENVGGATEIESFAPFAPETNTEYELGLRSEYLEHRVRVNLAAYRDNYSNLQVSSFILAADNQFASLVSNAATATIQGFEAETEAVVTEQLTVRASTAYTDAKYDKFVDITGNRSGQPFTVPRWTWSLSGRFVQPTAAGKLAFQLDYNWMSKVNLIGSAALTSQVTQPSVGVLNGRVNLHMNAWDADVAVFGRNLTAQKYYDDASTHESTGFNFEYAAPPRTYGIEVIKEFGK
jgi:iron complex outermembrane receptor protein